MLLKLYAHALSARSYVRNDVVSLSPVSPHTDGCGAHPSSLCRAKILLRLSRIKLFRVGIKYPRKFYPGGIEYPRKFYPGGIEYPREFYPEYTIRSDKNSGG